MRTLYIIDTKITMIISDKALYQIKQMSSDNFHWYIYYDKKVICVVIDVLLHIISYLTIDEIINLSRVSKHFYGLCNSNYVWGPRLFSTDSLPESTMQIIYNNNKNRFLSYYYFKHYVSIDYKLNGNPESHNYLDLLKNIINFVSNLCAPYYHSEIITDVKSIYLQMIKNEMIYDEVVYDVKIVKELHSLCKECEYIWKLHKTTNDCEMIMILKKNKRNKRQIKFKKYIMPFYVPTYIIKNVKTIIYAETLNRLLNLDINNIVSINKN